MCCGVPIRINTHTSLSCLEEDLLGDSLIVEALKSQADFI